MKAPYDVIKGLPADFKPKSLIHEHAKLEKLKLEANYYQSPKYVLSDGIQNDSNKPRKSKHDAE